MADMWDLKPDSGRAQDIIPVIIVFCEDGAVEPAYLNAMRSSSIQLSVIPNFGQHHQNIDNATNYLREKGMLVVVEGKEVLQLTDGAQVWCMYDRDKSMTPDGKDTAFNDSISTAEARGIRVAWSNDDFELWILLHFEDVPVSEPAYEHRDKYYDRLSELVRDALREDPNGARIVNHPKFTYRDFMKSGNKFVQFTLEMLKGKTGIARSRALALHQHFASPTVTPSQMSPCTMAYLLVDAILSAGGKEI